MLHGSLNHVSLTVSDLPQAMDFFGPLLSFLGYEPDPGSSDTVRINLSPRTAGAVNVWQARPELVAQRFDSYAPGLHHLAFNVDSREKIDALGRLVPEWGGRVTDSPAEYPYTNHGSYYAVYFRGPDDIKIECVYMSELARLHESLGTADRKLWPHEGG